MSVKRYRLDLGSVDWSTLKTDDDFRHQAKQLVPRILRKTGETLGDRAWKEMEKSFRGPGMKLTHSEKRKFIKQAADNYVRDCSTTEKRNVENQIIAQLRKGKAAQQTT